MQCCIECLRICGHYRPNHTPGTKSGVGACVRPTRQSRDCLRGRPLRAPPLFAAVRLALGIGTAHRCTRRFLRSARAQRRHSRRLFVVRCAILSRMHAVWFRAEYRPSPSGTTSRSLPPPAEFSPLGLLSHFASLRRAVRRVSRFPVAAHPRLRAAQSAAWSNINPSGFTLHR